MECIFSIAIMGYHAVPNWPVHLKPYRGGGSGRQVRLVLAGYARMSGL